jgi:heme/copper-type cytochrome/quinol oxidase subunit 1
MTRAILGEALLFFVPFAIFAVYLVLRRRNPLHWSSWSDQSLWLVIAGLVCVIVAFVVTGLTADRQTGAFEPTHLENGRVVPGRFK